MRNRRRTIGRVLCVLGWHRGAWDVTITDRIVLRRTCTRCRTEQIVRRPLIREACDTTDKGE